jgi:hypothetical protein
MSNIIRNLDFVWQTSRAVRSLTCRLEWRVEAGATAKPLNAPKSSSTLRRTLFLGSSARIRPLYSIPLRSMKILMLRCSEIQGFHEGGEPAKGGNRVILIILGGNPVIYDNLGGSLVICRNIKEGALASAAIVAAASKRFAYKQAPSAPSLLISAFATFAAFADLLSPA